GSRGHRRSPSGIARMSRRKSAFRSAPSAVRPAVSWSRMRARSSLPSNAEQLFGYTSGAGAGAQYAGYWTPQEVRQADADRRAKQGGPRDGATHPARDTIPGRLPSRSHDLAVHRAGNEIPPPNRHRVRRHFVHRVGLRAGGPPDRLRGGARRRRGAAAPLAGPTVGTAAEPGTAADLGAEATCIG